MARLGLVNFLKIANKHHLLCLDPEGIWNHPSDLMSRVGWQVKEGKVKCEFLKCSYFHIIPKTKES